MFVLDTNVVSELRKAKAGKADPNPVAWAQRLSPRQLFISAVSVLALETGVSLVGRRAALQGAMSRTWLVPSFAGRIPSFESAVVQRSTGLHVPIHAPNGAP